MSLIWCNVLNMWCSDMDDEEHDKIGCDGACRGCENSEPIPSEEEK